MSDSEIRAWLRDQGDNVSDRGPISTAARARYELAHGFRESDGPGDADFDVSEPGPPPDPEAAEARPRTIATPRTARLPWKRPGAARGRARAKHKRVALDDTIATGWRFLAGLARPLPATSRLMKIQAPVAGKLLEPIVKDTIVDRVLQPLARTTEGAEALAVLIGTPALVTAIQLNPQIAPFAMPALRELLLRMVKLTGPAMAEALKQEREFEAEFGGTVDDLIVMLFAGVFEDGPPAPEDEDAEVRKVQEAMEAAAA
jgi:hypothetical protein